VINRDLGFVWIGNNYLNPLPWLVVIALLALAASGSS
jgi:ribose transport system permease protein